MKIDHEWYGMSLTNFIASFGCQVSEDLRVWCAFTKYLQINPHGMLSIRWSWKFQNAPLCHKKWTESFIQEKLGTKSKYHPTENYQRQSLRDTNSMQTFKLSEKLSNRENILFCRRKISIATLKPSDSTVEWNEVRFLNGEMDATKSFAVKCSIQFSC